MKKNVIIIIITAVIFAAGAIGCLLVLMAPKSNTVSIKSGGREIYSIDLSAAEDCIFQIEFEGRMNTVEIKNHSIRVTEADCPDKICVNTAAITAGKSSAPIVCLPNRLVIEPANSSADGRTG
ncbi:MAG: NusG domain II-containing protein [Oscillospiraceae bacterium]|nr:NusG domain II-containing protein [Oscillospiraceae bacterium]